MAKHKDFIFGIGFTINVKGKYYTWFPFALFNNLKDNLKSFFFFDKVR